MLFFAYALFRNVDFVNGLRSWIVDFTGDRRLPDAPPRFVNQLHEQVALIVGHF